MKDYKEIYEDFWKDIVEDENGELNKEQVMKELADFHFLIKNIPKIYDHVTGGNCSNPMTLPEVVMSLYDDHRTEEIEFYIEDYRETYLNE